MGIHQAAAHRKSAVGIDQFDGDRRSVDAKLIVFRLEAEIGDEVESVEGAILVLNAGRSQPVEIVG